MFSNDDAHGGKMLEVVRQQIATAKDVTIASGYVSGDILTQFENDFYRIAESGGKVRLLVGMAFHEGISGRNLRQLQKIEERFKQSGGSSGIFVSYTRKFHGKIYGFGLNGPNDLYVGSSNFSRSGLAENLECTTKIKDADTQIKVRNYLEYLFTPTIAAPLEKANITALGSPEYLKRISLETLSDLTRYDPASINKIALAHFDYTLSRVVVSEKSSLNVYFGKGRWSRSTGKVSPRQWYEIELIAGVDISSNPLYPKGDFTAYTDDGYVMPMKTGAASSNYKNIRSRGNLLLLGQWIKGKLQKADALIPLTPVTGDTLARYGSDTIRFYKIADGEYYLEF